MDVPFYHTKYRNISIFSFYLMHCSIDRKHYFIVNLKTQEKINKTNLLLDN